MSAATLKQHPPLWDDGTFGVWEAKDVHPSVPRSKTRKSFQDAIKADPVEITFRPPVGAGSITDCIKVRLTDFVPRSLTGAPTAPAAPKHKEPFEVRWPHICTVCGGRMLNLFSSSDHPDENGEKGGKCPGPKKLKGKW